ncbi:translation initiation factor IF-2 subunit beta [Methanococcus aeolicus]|uniref:Translation initiation factor 2 subunit beta n=1 Tax=Methanococcus aeolicus (strain ATCC BAA-1280 / DSM 17508 / OCM 812 / Nankai-3) TaxID=419665 RepID=IF2B_META3|nr:translation initiation factor IF-2 subunit beta [Methanococcus aeolicus]A6UX55.1 RecName: Full=Translation initiation factor 2 subunit beta; AltName: Full=aIF2-beta; AltName: Full=eIF-2-beta [Methanococcus aeolicus Nankai-3]ABR57077.1 putative translation initiation factor aIF-2, beta subunit [Methanococcus aeolicus Nankai-3]UXM85086.1 translation initiation factor IF-2 subunit beta [Methanococcus aeolicus]
MNSDYYDYDALLKRAVSQLPEEVFKDVRFEVPHADSFVEGNRTMVKNFVDISKVIRREPQFFAKYVLKELGTAGDVEGPRLILQGKFGNYIINSKIKKFVDEYVLCPECGKPDTKIIKEGRIHFLKCMACGAMKPIKLI